jgi:prolipoprotein diacylglyceryltransferase
LRDLAPPLVQIALRARLMENLGSKREAVIFKLEKYMKSNQNMSMKFYVCLTFFSVGIPYWLIPYNKLNLPDALITPFLIVPFISCLLLRIRTSHKLSKITWLIGASMVGAVIARIFVDVIRDGTSHNLWPFEIIIASIISFPLALIGVFAGSLALKFFEISPNQ